MRKNPGLSIILELSTKYGASIAANSNVAKDTPIFAVFGGNPTKLIRYRFIKTQISKSFSIKLREWNDEIIQKSQPILSSPQDEHTLEESEVLIG